MDDDEPDAWPEIPQQKLDESMRCAICQEIYTMPVSFATCTHTHVRRRPACSLRIDSRLARDLSSAHPRRLTRSLHPFVDADCSLCIRRTLKEFKMECPACRAPERSLTSSPTTRSRLWSAPTAPRAPAYWQPRDARSSPSHLPRPSPPPRPTPPRRSRVRSDEARESETRMTPHRRNDPRKPDRRVAVDRQKLRRRR